MPEDIRYNKDTNDFDVDRPALMEKYGLGPGFAAGNVLLYEEGLITLDELRKRSCYERFSSENYQPTFKEWASSVSPIATRMGWRP